MIPLKLKLKGIYSYKEEQIIDFGILTQTQLFGIFGNTGSGKSSILEAITYALYGEVDRLGRNERSYNMMNLDCNEMMISFEFSVGKEKYLAEASAKRNSKNFEDIRPRKQLYRYENGEPIPSSLSSEEIIGLSYNNFRRTIIIPQGSFQEFIQLGNKDRTEMMKKLFRLEKYDLSNKVKNLETQNNNSQKEKEGWLEGLKDYTNEKLIEINQIIRTCETEADLLQKQLEEKKEQKQEIENNQKLLEKLTQKEKELHDLQTQNEQILHKKKELNEFKYCSQHFDSLLKEKNNVEIDIQELENQINDKNKRLKEYNNQLQSSEETFETKIKKNYEKRNEFAEKASELNTTIQIIQEYRKQRELTPRITTGQNKIKEKNDEIETKRGVLQAIKKRIETLNQQIADSEDLEDVKDWWNNQEKFDREIDQAQNRLTQITEEINKAKDRKQNLLNTLPIQLPKDDQNIKQFFEEILEKNSLQAEEFSKKINEREVQLRLKHYAENLTEGQPCPLCGSTHHPGTGIFDSPSGKADPLTEERDQNKKQRDTILSTRTTLEEIEKEQTRKEEAHTQYTQLLQQKIEKKQQDLPVFKWEKYHNNTIEEIQELSKYHRAIRENIKELDQEKDEIEKGLQKNAEELEKYRRLLLNLEAEENRRQGFIEGKTTALKHINWEQYQNTPENLIQQEADEFLKNHKDAETMFKMYENKIKETRDEINRISGILETERRRRDRQLLKKIELLTGINTKLDASPFQEIETILQILQKPIQIEAIEKEIENHRINIGIIDKEVSELRTQAEGKSFDPLALQALNTTIEDLKNRNEEVIATIGASRRESQTITTKLEEKKNVEEALAALRIRGENIQTLSKLFRSMGFVNYVSFAHLRQLCHVANERFMRLTNGMLQLGVTDEGELLVTDYFNNGRSRSIKTLSGGQTFQAALSLALALADSVHQAAHSKQNFFFIDEGFGSQDKESLRMIFQTLQSLRKENRIVGIISHVEELKTEIEVYLQVAQQGERGSIITESWRA